MKTISELNTKWWYRLTKTLCILFAIGISAIVVSFITGAYRPEFDIEESYVLCADERQFPVDKINMYSDYISDSIDETFRVWCDTTVITAADGTIKLKPKTGFIPDEKNYDFIAKYTPRDWVRTMGFSLLSIAGILLAFEIVRRVFYYILLGSLFPKKQ